MSGEIWPDWISPQGQAWSQPRSSTSWGLRSTHLWPRSGTSQTFASSLPWRTFSSWEATLEQSLPRLIRLWTPWETRSLDYANLVPDYRYWDSVTPNYERLLGFSFMWVNCDSSLFWQVQAMDSSCPLRCLYNPSDFIFVIRAWLSGFDH